MKTKGDPKKNMLPEGDRFDRKVAKVKTALRDKSSKRRLSIYDDFEDESLDQFDYDSDSVMENPFED
jgi:hypothetical protein